MMRPIFTSLISLFPAPAYAFAGAVPRLSLSSPGAGNPIDRFSMAGRNLLFDTGAHDRINTSLFAIDSDDTVLAPSRATESDGPDPVGVPSPPADVVTAYDVYTTLLSVPIRHKVFLNDVNLTILINYRGWIKQIAYVEHEAMKTVSARLESLEAELGELEQTLKQNRPTLRKFLNAVKALFDRKSFAQRECGSEFAEGRKGSVLNFTGMFLGLKAKKRDLEKEVDHARIAREWLDRIAMSNRYGYIFLTDKGRRVLAALDGAKGDPRMEKMSVDDYLKLIDAKI